MGIILGSLFTYVVVGDESKNMHFARRNWKVNSKKLQKYPLQNVLSLIGKVLVAMGEAGGLQGQLL